MKTFFIQTLGCKVNQYESDGIASGLEERGWTKGKKNADVVIVNTCAVTSKAAMQSRQAIRRLIRENPDAKVIVTGCHSQTDPEAIKKIDHIDHLVCHQDKLKIADHLASTGDDPFSLIFKKIDRTESNPFTGFHHAVKGDMTRAYLKIQDGCNAFCTYCVVPYARGASLSMPETEVLRHLRELGASGVNEVILTGIHAGMYGLDFKEKSSLLDLLTRIDREHPVYRLRLSSIEPCEINEGIIRLARPGHILCDHFHIPLQSGDDDILKKMKRPYDRFFFKDMVQMIHEILPFAGIGVDTLIGFPSETDRQFQNTYELIESLPISYLHVFPFSARKGTPAYHFDPKVDEKTIKDRCAKMRTLDKMKRREFVGRNLNQKQEGLVQNTPDKKTGLLKAVTSNYLTVLLKGGPELCGKILDLIPEQWDKDLIVKGRTA
ncbi:MAG: tRNA (N(6)-L-threonylcarbamoyladenosine(37)-C(2))-methylthiotransferase MtaB [Desulfobacula sp. RIFOXYA12_FULL_46_16]|nr:MAG: tRNA (N(6)-L-threonylcarbamoyladenosine(37)-C(2))-methylthiotransferase MtaB [Deltaproteobacteria bacterium RIFOXYC2_FULL_48_10]OGR21494.1 MAG: tRNA (N(6)-L-threonylcarbamoyladenosine(37)-C(2))-methylthiotransferase MtaB [Desulfobacula sp. RIFOXYA12_FULL_46_16]